MTGLVRGKLAITFQDCRGGGNLLTKVAGPDRATDGSRRIGWFESCVAFTNLRRVSPTA